MNFILVLIALQLGFSITLVMCSYDPSSCSEELFWTETFFRILCRFWFIIMAINLVILTRKPRQSLSKSKRIAWSSLIVSLAFSLGWIIISVSYRKMTSAAGWVSSHRKSPIN